MFCYLTVSNANTHANAAYARHCPTQENSTATVSYLALSGDEDIYAYGDSDPDPVWTLSSDTVVFREKLTSGHFAEIRKAKLVINRKQAITVP